MVTVEGKATVTEDGKLTMQMPASVTQGEHRVVLVIEERSTPLSREEKIGDTIETVEAESSALGFPAINVDHWPEDFSLRREAMYAEWGR